MEEILKEILEQIQLQSKKTDERFDAMDRRFDGMDGRLDKMDSRLTRLETKVEHDIGNKLQMLFEQGKGFNQKLDHITDELVEMKEQLMDHKIRITALENRPKVI